MNNSISIYLDQLRISRNITREKFVDGILSERQYRRYLKGESVMPNDKVSSLVGRLGLDLTNVYSNYFSIENEERKLVEEIYTNIVVNNYKKAHQMIKNIKINVFQNSSNQQFFEMCKIMTEEKLELIPEKLSTKLMQELIQYPSCLELKKISFNELVALLFISGNVIKEENDETILNYLTDMIEKDTLSNSINRIQWMPSIYFNVARSHGILGHYEQVLLIAKMGINFCLNNEIMNSLNHLLYIKAYSNYKLDNINECLVDVRHIFSLLKLQDNNIKTDHFAKLIEKHMGFNQNNI